MYSRIGQLLIAELLAFGGLVCGGLALLGAAVTWSGESLHRAEVSWALVALFACASGFFCRAAAIRLKRAWQRPSDAA